MAPYPAWKKERLLERPLAKLLSIGATKHSTTGVSPAMLMIGRDKAAIWFRLVAKPNPEHTSPA